MFVDVEIDPSPSLQRDDTRAKSSLTPPLTNTQSHPNPPARRYLVAKSDRSGLRFWGLYLPRTRSTVEIYYMTGGIRTQRVATWTVNLKDNTVHRLVLAVTGSQAVLAVDGTMVGSLSLAGAVDDCGTLGADCILHVAQRVSSGALLGCIQDLTVTTFSAPATTTTTTTMTKPTTPTSPITTTSTTTTTATMTPMATTTTTTKTTSSAGSPVEIVPSTASATQSTPATQSTVTDPAIPSTLPEIVNACTGGRLSTGGACTCGLTNCFSCTIGATTGLTSCTLCGNAWYLFQGACYSNCDSFRGFTLESPSSSLFGRVCFPDA